MLLLVNFIYIMVVINSILNLLDGKSFFSHEITGLSHEHARCFYGLVSVAYPYKHLKVVKTSP